MDDEDTDTECFTAHIRNMDREKQGRPVLGYINASWSKQGGEKNVN